MAAHNEQKSELIAQLADRRRTLTARKEAIEESINVKQRINNSLRSHPVPTILGGLVGGFIVARIFKGVIFGSKSKKKTKSHGRLKAFLITTIVAAAKPTIKHWVFEQTKIQFRKRFNRPQKKSALGDTHNL